jgi:hypothetical protein
VCPDCKKIFDYYIDPYIPDARGCDSKIPRAGKFLLRIKYEVKIFKGEVTHFDETGEIKMVDAPEPPTVEIKTAYVQVFTVFQYKDFDRSGHLTSDSPLKALFKVENRPWKVGKDYDSVAEWPKKYRDDWGKFDRKVLDIKLVSDVLELAFE